MPRFIYFSILALLLTACGAADTSNDKAIRDAILAEKEDIAAGENGYDADYGQTIALDGAATITAPSGLNMREEPFSGSPKINKLAQGQRVELIRRETTKKQIGDEWGYWTQVDYNGQIGWVFGAWLSNNTATETSDKPGEQDPLLTAVEGKLQDAIFAGGTLRGLTPDGYPYDLHSDGHKSHIDLDELLNTYGAKVNVTQIDVENRHDDDMHREWWLTWTNDKGESEIHVIELYSGKKLIASADIYDNTVDLGSLLHLGMGRNTFVKRMFGTEDTKAFEVVNKFEFSAFETTDLEAYYFEYGKLVRVRISNYYD